MKLRIGDKLAGIRQERKLTQIEMAELLGVPDSTYARYERNETQIDYSKLVNFAEKLNLPIHELIPDTIAINNNSTHSGQGSCVIFGNQYSYFGDNVANSAILQENKELKENIVNLEKKIEEILAGLQK